MAETKKRRDEDPNYVWNPTTRRWIKKSGKVYQKILLDKIAGIEPDPSSKNSIIAKGSPEELKVMYEKLKNNKQLVPHNHELIIRNNQLCVVRRKIKKLEIQKGVKSATQEAILENRELLRSDLSDEQLNFLLGRIVDLKLMGKKVNVEKEVDQLLGLKKKSKTQEEKFDKIRSPRPRRRAPRMPKKRFQGSSKPVKILAKPSKFNLIPKEEITDWGDTTTDFESEFE